MPKILDLISTTFGCDFIVLIKEKIVHWPPTNQWAAALQPNSLLV